MSPTSSSATMANGSFCTWVIQGAPPSRSASRPPITCSVRIPNTRQPRAGFWSGRLLRCRHHRRSWVVEFTEPITSDTRSARLFTPLADRHRHHHRLAELHQLGVIFPLDLATPGNAANSFRGRSRASATLTSSLTPATVTRWASPPSRYSKPSPSTTRTRSSLLRWI